jgi:hypothetical protein
MPPLIINGRDNRSQEARIRDRLDNKSVCTPDSKVTTWPNRTITTVYNSGSQAAKPASDFADQAYGGDKE